MENLLRMAFYYIQYFDLEKSLDKIVSYTPTTRQDTQVFWGWGGVEGGVCVCVQQVILIYLVYVLMFKNLDQEDIK
jgi:hypothetical protein